MNLLLDADVFCYQATNLKENSRQNALYIAHSKINEVINKLSPKTYTCFISGSSNFRKDINPDYKAQRPQEKPPYFYEVKEFIIREFPCVVSSGCEADDMLGVSQTAETVIASMDKDLLQIPGRHYKLPIMRNKQLVSGDEFLDVSEEQGLRWFYMQMLIGDSTDNIKGVRGYGPKKAELYLSTHKTEDEMEQAVKSLYNDDERFMMNADCLWIWRKLGETWSYRKKQTMDSSKV